MSDAEGLLAIILGAEQYEHWPPFEREHTFAPPRRWRFDFAWPSQMLALEVEGGVWTGGRHTTSTGFLGDLEKYNEASIAGWTLLRVTPEQVHNGEALTLLERVMEGT